jgi:hypothetical protein
MLGASPGSMSRTDHVVLFRSDGTFNSEWRTPDWKTSVTGHYTISGKNVVMRYDKGGGKDEYTLEDGALSGGSYTLIKMTELNNVPAG